MTRVGSQRHSTKKMHLLVQINNKEINFSLVLFILSELWTAGQITITIIILF